ncbi:MAG: Dabb family protein [Chitinophagaceae bacterium]
MKRRSFINAAALATPVIFAATTQNSMAQIQGGMEGDTFVHHVYFWLKSPESKADKDKLVEGLRKLSKVSTIKTFHIGQPAPTNRDVIDRSYSISWLLIFNNKADQDSYQADPIHLKFVEECASLWSRVVVYDSVNVFH